MKQYYKSSKAIFIIFIVGSLLLNLLMIYMYGNTVTYMMSKNINTNYYCKYTVNLGSFNYQELQKQLDDILQEYNIKDISFYSCLEENDEYIFLASSKNDNVGLQWQKTKGRIYFTEADIESKEKYLIVPYEWKLSPGDRKNLSVLGEFEVVGVGMYAQYGYIPSWIFEAANLPVTCVDIILEERLSMEENQLFLDRLAVINGEESVISAYGIFEDSVYSRNDILALVVLWIFAIASFLFLLQYITVLNKKFDAVSELVGATKGTTAFLLLLERFVLSMISIFCGIIIHRLFYDSIFERFNLTSIDYEWKDYCIIIAMVVLASVLASIPFVISYTRKSAINTVRE